MQVWVCACVDVEKREGRGGTKAAQKANRKTLVEGKSSD